MADSPGSGAEPLSPRILAVGTFIAIGAAVVLIVVNTVNVLLLDSRFAQFAASEEHTTFTWAASSATFTAAFVAALHVVARLGDARLYAATAVVLAFFSLDDTLEIHERLGDRLGDVVDAPADLGNRAWMIVYAPLLAAAFALLWFVSRRMAAPIRRYALAGLGLLLVGVVLEGAGIWTNRLLEDGTPTPHRLRAGIEEAAELSGWILIATALTASFFSRLIHEREAPGRE